MMMQRNKKQYSKKAVQTQQYQLIQYLEAQIQPVFCSTTFIKKFTQSQPIQHLQVSHPKALQNQPYQYFEFLKATSSALLLNSICSCSLVWGLVLGCVEGWDMVLMNYLLLSGLSRISSDQHLFDQTSFFTLPTLLSLSQF